jgi:putative N6-adenine-specific DNA methylase
VKLFVVAAPGLEGVVAGEVRALGLEPVETAGGVEVEGDDAALWRVNLRARAATRVLVRVVAGRATDFARLRRLAAQAPWERYIAAPVAIEIAATCHRSRLYHSGAVAERVRGGIADRLGAGAIAGERPMRLVVRGEDDVFTLSVDSSGELLHRRGYRAGAVEAPLRETLAAGVLALAGWRPDEPLLDPTCGSGTFVIEAALAATARAPGAGRRFAFESFPGFDAARFAAVAGEVPPRPAPAPLVGLDRDPDAIAAARENAARAGVAAETRFEIVDARDAQLPDGPPGLVVANPPYGRRLAAGAALYARLGALARSRRWRLALLCPDPRLAARAGRFDRRIALKNGGLSVWLFLAG